MPFQDIVLTIYLVSIWAKNISSITYIQLLNSNGIMFYLLYSNWQNIQSYGETMQVSSTLTSTKFIWGSLISFDLHNIPKIAKKTNIIKLMTLIIAKSCQHIFALQFTHPHL